MTSHTHAETVVQRFRENNFEVTSIVADPADAQQVLYGTVTRNGVLVGSYYCTDRVRQSGWRVVTADGEHLTFGNEPVELAYDGDAVFLLTKNADSPASPA
ncbi:hypothetical protein C8D87_11628 [Lentzea atacamensis]|uniref:Uncharacterized protein n=1 Tax=Lentzea atacamensis TaxID=531938 RepID=A0ABX9DYB4_9PSEU|nr:hypothetical protein [Lentzea atacamensis]RAS58975.1 hypothetical protein C8D87_11628 [Lentzea atacamensis]